MSQTTASKPIRITYWAVTILLSALLTFAAVNHLTLTPEMIAMNEHLGFPVALLPFLAILKILGVMTILFIRRGDMTVGAYAGIFFYGLGAMAVHLTAGDPFSKAVGGLMIVVLGLSSYFLWKRVRQAAMANEQVASSRTVTQNQTAYA